MFTPRSDGVSMRWRCSLRPDVADGVRGGVGVAVGVAVEAGDALVRPSRCGGRRSALNCCCGNGVTSSRRPSSCFGLRMSLNSSLEVVERDQLALRDVAEVGPRGQEDRRRELGQQVVGQVEVEVEARQVAARSASSISSISGFGKSMPPASWCGCGSGKKPAGQAFWSLISSGVMRGELVPGHAGGQLDAHAVLHGLAARHRHARRRAVGEVVARGRAGPAAAWRTSASPSACAG